MGIFTKTCILKKYKATNVGRSIVTLYGIDGEPCILQEGMSCIINKNPKLSKVIVEEIIDKTEKIIVKKDKKMVK